MLQRVRSLCLVLVCTLGLFSTAAVVAQAEDGRCLIVVDGRTRLKGNCNIEVRPAGSFTVGIGAQSRSDYFAYVDLDGARGTAAHGYWNGPDAAEHAHDDLGPLTRKGACWVNARARICAWRSR